MDEPLVFDDLEIGTEFCWDHRRDKIDGWCVGTEHGLLKKRSKDTYASIDRPDDWQQIWRGAESWRVRRDTDECGGVSLCTRCKTALYNEVRRVLFAKVELCDDCQQMRDEEVMAAAAQAKHQRFLRRLVDVVWNEATESEAVPSTDWADRLIARAQKEDAEDQSVIEEDLPYQSVSQQKEES